MCAQRWPASRENPATATTEAVTPGAQLSVENLDWINEFRRVHGRAPRILHIGNIANNAYKNARLLNEAGLDCDVICYDYYHLMGCPEWEDVDFDGAIKDHFRPDWASIDLHGYPRPRWFAQGPLPDCIDYLVARRRGAEEAALRHWTQLGIANRTIDSRSKHRTGLGLLWFSSLRALPDLAVRAARILAADPHVVLRLGLICEQGRIGRRIKNDLLRIVAAISLLAAALALRLLVSPLRFLWKPEDPRGGYSFQATVVSLIDKFDKVFPLRTDRLCANDAGSYQDVVQGWRSLLTEYDIVQAYATDPIIPMLCNYRPYIGFEHGTLRDFTLGDNNVCRLTSLAYHLADHVFITNGDCVDFARNIGVTKSSPMLHPIDVNRITQVSGDYAGLHRDLDADYLFLCPLRHDWKIKGTDIYIRALPALRTAIGSRFRLIMTRWGSQLRESETLARSLKCADLIHWIDPLPRKRLIRMQKSVDVVFDQMALPHFGATAPEALACGVPVIMSYDPASTRWIVPEPAPILTARNPDDVVSRVQFALDPEWRSRFTEKAALWVKEYHSDEIVINRHLDVYRTLISGAPTRTSHRGKERSNERRCAGTEKTLRRVRDLA